MPSHYIIANFANREYLSPHEFGEDPHLLVYEYTEEFFGSLVYLTRITPQTGLISLEHGFRYAGSWHGQHLNVIGEQEATKMYNVVLEDYMNISQAVRKEWDKFLEKFADERIYSGNGLSSANFQDFEKKLDEYMKG